MTIPHNPTSPDARCGCMGSTHNPTCPVAIEGEKARKDFGAKTELVRWWTDLAHKDAETTVPKAIEYGAADLHIMGTAMMHLMPKGSEQPERVGLELACAFYALGKVARLFGAYEQGRLPSDDTWFDLSVYCTMARRIRETGSWV